MPFCISRNVWREWEEASGEFTWFSNSATQFGEVWFQPGENMEKLRELREVMQANERDSIWDDIASAVSGWEDVDSGCEDIDSDCEGVVPDWEKGEVSLGLECSFVEPVSDMFEADGKEETKLIRKEIEIQSGKIAREGELKVSLSTNA